MACCPRRQCRYQRGDSEATSCRKFVLRWGEGDSAYEGETRERSAGLIKSKQTLFAQLPPPHRIVTWMRVSIMQLIIREGVKPDERSNWGAVWDSAEDITLSGVSAGRCASALLGTC